MSKQALKHLIYFAPFMSFGALFLVLNLTSPLDMGPAGILLVFALLYLFLLSSLYVLLLLVVALIVRFGIIKQPLKKRKLYYITSVISLGPVFLLALNSIGQLDFKDFALVILLVAVACFYITRRF
jgi:hypothetical protein